MTKNNRNVVYSTNPYYDYNDENEELEPIENKSQQLKVQIDRKQRKGKSVTLITGFVGSPDELKELAKTLKSKCGVGGGAKNNEIIIQGEFKDKIYELLISLDFSQTKKVGG